MAIGVEGLPENVAQSVGEYETQIEAIEPTSDDAGDTIEQLRREIEVSDIPDTQKSDLLDLLNEKERLMPEREEEGTQPTAAKQPRGIFGRVQDAFEEIGQKIAAAEQKAKEGGGRESVQAESKEVVFSYLRDVIEGKAQFSDADFLDRLVKAGGISVEQRHQWARVLSDWLADLSKEKGQKLSFGEAGPLMAEVLTERLKGEGFELFKQYGLTQEEAAKLLDNVISDYRQKKEEGGLKGRAGRFFKNQILPRWKATGLGAVAGAAPVLAGGNPILWPLVGATAGAAMATPEGRKKIAGVMKDYGVPTLAFSAGFAISFFSFLAFFFGKKSQEYFDQMLKWKPARG